MSLRVSVCLNAGPRKGQPQTTLVAPPQTEAILSAAANKLRLKKKEVGRARLFVWRTGYELPRDGEVEPGRVRNDDLLAISFGGEQYAGPCQADPLDATPTAAEQQSGSGDAPGAEAALEEPPLIGGIDDAGRSYASLRELWAEQARQRDSYYAANDAWWDADGYGGDTDDEAMIGDGGSPEDLEHSQRLLDAVRAARPALRLESALDAGAGIGRVTKAVLLRRCERVALLEPCERWLRQARRYLGNKRAQRCAFVGERLEAHVPAAGVAYDLIWVQWTLQYLVDADVVAALRRLGGALTTPHGVLVAKENRPLREGAEGARFAVDTPGGPNARHDVTRPHAHHEWLFRCAGLAVEHWEHAGATETTAWVLRPTAEARAAEARRRLRWLHRVQAAILACTLASCALALLSLAEQQLDGSALALPDELRDVARRATRYVPVVLAAAAAFASFIEAEQMALRARGADASAHALERLDRWFEGLGPGVPEGRDNGADTVRTMLVQQAEQALRDEVAACVDMSSDRRAVVAKRARAVAMSKLGRRGLTKRSSS